MAWLEEHRAAWRLGPLWLALFGLLLVGRETSAAVDYNQAVELFQTGEYRRCAELAVEAITAGEYSENWRILKIEAEWMQGDYLAALETLDVAQRRYFSSVRLRWLGSRVCRDAGLIQRADQLQAEIAEFVQRSPYSYSDPASRIAVGQYLLADGADARRVLELFFDRVKQRQPDYVDAYLAAGQLALDKHDYQVAAKEFTKALDFAPDHPDALFGLAQAYAESDREKADEFLQRTLLRNPAHLPAQLFVAERHIDAERYREAEAVLDEVEAVNPELPAAWAYRAVIAHLESRHEDEGLYRRIALGWWPLNPAVDSLIGRKLSQHYRFAEGAKYQRRALAMDEQYFPAKFLLAQDLMRQGDDEGWRLNAQVFEHDGYNVVAHNLLKLEERLAKFRTLTSHNLIIRMDGQEADVYGPQVLQLLERARDTLCAKYQFELTEPVIVEIFPEQPDFAIRTFGLPGGEGFLGVCFGRVITANSPAAQGANPSNWQAVLWHEFCHVVTLRKTDNKMPRWLSEGISVYEELQENSTWGQRMTPQYREWIVTDQMPPVSEMSSAFLRPRSAAHLQFAYYQAALVVEFIVDRFGFEALVRILNDLQGGILLEDALPRHTVPLPQLDAAFSEHARQRAAAYGSELNWEQPDEATRQDPAALEAWKAQHPDSYLAQYDRAQSLIRGGQWAEARDLLQVLVAKCPEHVGSDSPYLLLAAAYRGLNETPAERAVLEELARRSDAALSIYERLIELAEQAEDWPAMLTNCERALAVQPLRPAAQRSYATAARRLGRQGAAIAAYQALLALDPGDPADLHYQLARLHRERFEYEPARYHVIRALEEAPRFRAAQALLLEVIPGERPPAPPEPPLPGSSSGSQPARPADAPLREVGR